MTPEEATRLIRVSTQLIDAFGSRDYFGRLIKAEWGEPDADGVYEPTFTTTDDGYSLVPTADLDRLRAVERQIETLDTWRSGNMPIILVSRSEVLHLLRDALGDRAAEEGRTVRAVSTGYGTDNGITVKATRWPDDTYTVETVDRAAEEGRTHE